MLISFSVENFLSFRDRQTLTLEASRDSTAPQNVITDAQGTGLDLLRGAVVYGANASGKSNLFKAMSFVRSYVLYSSKDTPKRSPTGAIPFKLSDSFKNSPTTFEIQFLHENVQYLYGFSLDSQVILDEWLFSYPEKRRRILYTRKFEAENKEAGVQAYYWGPSWTGEKNRLAEMTRPDVLFLSVASQFNHPITSAISEWFQNHFRPLQSSLPRLSESVYTIDMCDRDPDNKKKVLDFLKKADLAINDFKIRKYILNDDNKPPDFPSHLLDFLTDELKISPDEVELREPEFYRSGLDAHGNRQAVPFNESEESDGTIKLFSLSGPLIHAREHGCCLFVDELDNHLHPHLTRAIVEFFMNSDINHKGAQIVFAAHDTNLLEDRMLLRRDQVWLTEKDEAGATELYSLWDYKIRKDENLEKGYLAGRYRGVPFIERLAEPVGSIEDK